jgi:signal peptidase I
MTKYAKIICLLITAILVLVGCSGTIGNRSRVTLITGGYGYTVGDIVLLDTQKKPAVGDIVQYNWYINKSNCGAMGPNLYLAKIVGLPGDDVIFQQSSYKANGYICAVNGYEIKQVLWGSEKFDDVAGMKLQVPANEYLADKWMGNECTPGGAIVAGSSEAYNRFTVKQEAITGVILQKLGHDKEFEEEQKQIVY